MGGTGVVDRFLDVFTRYIDSGFGLLGGEVAFIATTVGLGCGLVAYVALWILMPRATVAPVVVADEPAP